ncbi:hypothetical protein HNY73_020666 [Argiope bruennichi]|uniref:Uncharacterized protein n=1 Tax=Argiope bruennichi TaxID=94029 RepID=A0A8T0E8Q2_ARGBR|nr:hypothetical protein HNY73_020666 [Argiope bruennichi]
MLLGERFRPRNPHYLMCGSHFIHPNRAARVKPSLQMAQHANDDVIECHPDDNLSEFNSRMSYLSWKVL